MSAQILVTKPQTLSAADKTLLRKAGIVCIEATKPNDVRLLNTEGPPMGGDDLLYAAVQALSRTGDQSAALHAKTRFVEIIAKILEDRRPTNA